MSISDIKMPIETLLGGNIRSPDTLVALVLANFEIFMMNFEKNVRFGGLKSILATFFGRYA